MELIATPALKPGMQLAEDVLDNRGHVIIKKGIRLDKILIEKITLNNIFCVNIMEAEDYVTNYFDKVRNSKTFGIFNKLYFENFTAYKVSVEFLVYNKAPINNDDLLNIIENISKPVNQNKTTLLDLLSVLDTGDKDFLFAHGLNVALICNYTASWFNLTDEEKQILILCGFYYDIGKFLVPKEIIWKQGKLTNEEFDIMKKHPVLGYSLLQDINIDPNIKLATLQHHERCDCSGYPQKLPDEKINKFAKIIAILDAYEAMTSYRSYREPLCPFKVVEILERDGFGKYDTDYYLTFRKRIVEEYIGKEVMLNDGTVCKVILINDHSLARPMVMSDSGMYIDLSKEKQLSIEKLM